MVATKEPSEQKAQPQAAGDMKALRLQVSSSATPPEPGMKYKFSRGWYHPTPEEVERDKKNEIEAKALMEGRRMLEVSERRRAANIPLRLSKKIDTALLTPPAHGWRRRLDKINEKIGTGFLYSIVGTYGVGKSQLGVALAWQACEQVSALFIHAPELFDTIKDVFRGDDGETVREQLARFIKPKLLVIDEVNQGISEADIRYLHRVVCQRYDDMTDTLLISNENKSAFQSLVGDRVVSRMIECGGIIEADWPSFRK